MDLSAKCGICQRVLSQGELVTCPRCKALYHPDCWAYNRERCAIFGCGSPQRPVAPAGAEAADDRRGLIPITTLGTLIALVGLVPLLSLWSFVREGGSIGPVLANHPVAVLLDVAMGTFPIAWTLICVGRSPRARRVTAIWGVIVLCAWGVDVLNESRRDVYGVRKSSSAPPAAQTCSLTTEEVRGEPRSSVRSPSDAARV